jgi:hypothetical protein
MNLAETGELVQTVLSIKSRILAVDRGNVHL